MEGETSVQVKIGAGSMEGAGSARILRWAGPVNVCAGPAPDPRGGVGWSLRRPDLHLTFIANRIESLSREKGSLDEHGTQRRAQGATGIARG